MCPEPRARVLSIARWVLSVGLVAASSLLPLGGEALAHSLPNVEEQLTRFEQFLVDVCSPCVRESVPIATLSFPAVKLPAGLRAAGGRPTRSGEISIEALRSHVLGRPSRQLLAIRLTVSVATGNPGEVYRIAFGMVDEEEIDAFTSNLAELIREVPTPTPADPGAEFVEIDAHSGSVRVGVIRLKSESVVYVQAGDVRTFERRSVWDTPTTVYLPVADLTTLRGAIAQAGAKIQKMRGGR